MMQPFSAYNSMSLWLLTTETAADMTEEKKHKNIFFKTAQLGQTSSDIRVPVSMTRSKLVPVLDPACEETGGWKLKP